MAFPLLFCWSSFSRQVISALLTGYYSGLCDVGYKSFRSTYYLPELSSVLIVVSCIADNVMKIGKVYLQCSVASCNTATRKTGNSRMQVL